MGIVRKGLSVATLGIVSFRSKKERLRRAERSRRDAETALVREHEARAAAEARVTAAEKRVKHAAAEAAHAAKRLEQNKRRRRARRVEGLSELFASAEPIVRSGVDTARAVSTDAAKRGRLAGRRARRTAEHSARDARKAAERSLLKAKAAAVSTREAVAPHAERVAAKAGEALEHLTSR